MPVKNILHYVVLNSLKISKKEALQCIENEGIVINGKLVFENVFIKKTDEIRYKDHLLQAAKVVKTILYYKPRGVECTLNPTIPDNLRLHLPTEEELLYPIGRLDKASEGLLLLTNDGDLYRSLNHYGTLVEKEYVVQTDKPIDSDFVKKMSEGIEIMGQKTLPCEVYFIDNQTFKIILQEGRNRQIRRMCYKLGYEVTTLKRIRIGEYALDSLRPNEWQLL